MIGANFCIFSLFLHFGKSLTFSRVLSFQKLTIWVSGAAIFLLSLGTAFTGYVLVSGNMSFWAALVILNLFTVVPLFGNEIVSFLLGGTTVSSWSLRRFTVIHFLLAIISLAVVLAHLVILHRNSPSKQGNDIADGSSFLISVIFKDLGLTAIILVFIFIESSRTFIHPDN